MSIEKMIENLTEALAANTAALNKFGTVGITLPVGAAATDAAIAKVTAAQKKSAAPQANDAPPVTLEQVKTLVTKAVNAIGKPAVAEALEKASPGAKNASTVKPEHYASLVADLETQIANAAADA